MAVRKIDDIQLGYTTLKKSLQGYTRVFKSVDETTDLMQIDNKAQATIGSYLSSGEALKDMERKESVTTLLVCLDKDESIKDIVGFFTLQASAVSINRNGDIVKGIPSVRVTHFAVDYRYQDTFHEDILLATKLFSQMIVNILDMTKTMLGVKIVYLRTLDTAKNFYLRCGMSAFDEEYKALPDESEDCETLMLVLEEIDKNSLGL